MDCKIHKMAKENHKEAQRGIIPLLPSLPKNRKKESELFMEWWKIAVIVLAIGKIVDIVLWIVKRIKK